MFAGLPAAVVSVSPYSLGGFGANHALRQSFVYLDLAVMQQPEAYVVNVKDVMDENGKITNEKTDALLTEFMHAFERWTQALGGRAEEGFAAFLARREAVSGEYINGFFALSPAYAGDMRGEPPVSVPLTVSRSTLQGVDRAHVELFAFAVAGVAALGIAAREERGLRCRRTGIERHELRVGRGRHRVVARSADGGCRRRVAGGA